MPMSLTQFSFTLVVGAVRPRVDFSYSFSFFSFSCLLDIDESCEARFSSTMANLEDRAAHESIFNLLLLLRGFVAMMLFGRLG